MDDERRRYFRIQDTIEIGFRTLTEEEREDPDALLGRGEELDGVEKELARLLIQVQSKHPDFSRIVELLNRKIDFLHHSLAKTSRMDMTREYELRLVDISGCGAAIPVTGRHGHGDLLLLQFNLPAPFRPVRTIAKVVSCKPLKTPRDLLDHMVRVEFDHIMESDQEILIQYLMKRQVLELKARREARERNL